MNSKAPTQPPTTAELAAMGGVKPSAPPPQPKHNQPTQFKAISLEQKLLEAVDDILKLYGDVQEHHDKWYKIAYSQALIDVMRVLEKTEILESYDLRRYHRKHGDLILKETRLVT